MFDSGGEFVGYLLNFCQIIFKHQIRGGYLGSLGGKGRTDKMIKGTLRTSVRRVCLYPTTIL